MKEENKTDLAKWEGRNTHGDTPQKTNERSINDVLTLAIQNNLDPALIEKMMNLAERHEKNEARKCYFDAIAKFKAEAPTLKKDKYNKWLDCWYTSLGNLLDTYNPYLAKQGLSVSHLPPEQDEKTLTVECRLSHSMGHVESMRMTGPIDNAAIGKQSGKPSRNPMQDLRSTFTYLRATTLEAILGVSGTEATQDDDGNATATQYIDEKQKSTIVDLISESGADELKVLEYAQAKTLETIPVDRFDMVVNALQGRIRKNKEEALKGESNDNN